jgi:hypothetical protein
MLDNRMAAQGPPTEKLKTAELSAEDSELRTEN